MTKKKTKKIKREYPNPDTLELNMNQVVRKGVFPLVTEMDRQVPRERGKKP